MLGADHHGYIGRMMAEPFAAALAEADGDEPGKNRLGRRLDSSPPVLTDADEGSRPQDHLGACPSAPATS